MDVGEEVQFDQWHEFARLRLDMLDYLSWYRKLLSRHDRHLDETTNLAINIPWRNTVSCQVVQHNVYLDGIPVKTFVYFGRLNEVSDV